jgi:hypothetical protein
LEAETPKIDAKTTKTVEYTPILLAEAEDYEYAGDDYL